MSRTFKDKPYKVVLAQSSPATDEPWRDHTPRKWVTGKSVKDNNGNPILVEQTRVVSYRDYETYVLNATEPRETHRIPLIPETVTDNDHHKTVWKRYDNSVNGITYYVRKTITVPLTNNVSDTSYDYYGCTINIEPCEENNWGNDLPCHYWPAFYRYNPYGQDSKYNQTVKRRKNRRDRYNSRKETRIFALLANNGEGI